MTSKQTTIDDLIQILVGKPFELECSEIAVHGMLDHHPPLYKGPGAIKSGKDGKIAFRMHNQIETSPEALSSLQWFKPEGGLEPASHVRILAEDYKGVSWLGAWSLPRQHHSRGINSVISGDFDQLTTRIAKVRGDKRKGMTEMVYADRLDLPLTQWLENVKRKGRKVIKRELYLAQHDLEFADSKISIFHSENEELTHITATSLPDFRPPLVENWIPDAIVFMTARLVYPRLTIRHFEKDALMFLRAYPSDRRTGVPSPFYFLPASNFWPMFTLYLSKCQRDQPRDSIEPIELTRLWREVISASTGTVQAFVLSLALCIENLIGQLFDELNVKGADENQVKELRTYVEEWKGENSVKTRALGLLTMLQKQPVGEALKKLKAEKTITKNHSDAWQKIRPQLAHGAIIKNPFDPIFWETRSLLMDMTYRLAFRILGYRGKIEGPFQKW
jgi:hypothetical protein